MKWFEMVARFVLRLVDVILTHRKKKEPAAPEADASNADERKM